MILIRNADVNDIEALFEIETLCFEKPWSMDAFSRTLANLSARIYTAEEDGNICGYVSCYMMPPYECQIGNVAVHPDFRRRGAAGKLLEALIKDSKELGIEEINLEVRPSNTGAIALYKKYGFTEIGRRTGYYEGKEDAILMRR